MYNLQKTPEQQYYSPNIGFLNYIVEFFENSENIKKVYFYPEALKIFFRFRDFFKSLKELPPKLELPIYESDDKQAIKTALTPLIENFFVRGIEVELIKENKKFFLIFKSISQPNLQSKNKYEESGEKASNFNKFLNHLPYLALLIPIIFHEPFFPNKYDKFYNYQKNEFDSVVKGILSKIKSSPHGFKIEEENFLCCVFKEGRLSYIEPKKYFSITDEFVGIFDTEKSKLILFKKVNGSLMPVYPPKNILFSPQLGVVLDNKFYPLKDYFISKSQKGSFDLVKKGSPIEFQKMEELYIKLDENFFVVLSYKDKLEVSYVYVSSSKKYNPTDNTYQNQYNKINEGKKQTSQPLIFRGMTLEQLNKIVSKKELTKQEAIKILGLEGENLNYSLIRQKYLQEISYYHPDLAKKRGIDPEVANLITVSLNKAYSTLVKFYQK
ncbi:MAG: hypothetical protein QXH71_03700 [Candidatus Anstonellaceae archaeon]